MIALAPSTLAPSATALRVKLFADGADLDSLVALARDSAIAGFTTNPTLMRKAGVADGRVWHGGRTGIGVRGGA